MSDQDADESFFDNVRFQPVVDAGGGTGQDARERSAQDADAGTGAHSRAGTPLRPTRRQRFRTWRRSRPFWAGLLCILGGCEIALIPLTAYRIILVSHSVAVAALVGAVIAILGLTLWMTPSHNKLYGLVVLVLALVSFVTSNVGGFVLGGLVSIFGGALGFAWDVLPEAKATPEASPLPEAPRP